MRSVLRRDAWAVCLLGLAFLLQFQMAKHWGPWLAINPFSEDPYDAVGSFAVQFVLFMMLVSLVRAFRPYPDENAAVGSFRRGTLMTSAAVGLTCLSDLIAMARHRDVWLGRGQGIQLFAVTALLLFWSVAAAGWFLLSTREGRSKAPEMRRLAVAGTALLLLAVYPENLRNSAFGAVLTAFCGAVLLFVAIWSVGTGLLPTSDVSDSDLVDDVTALLSPWLFGRAGSEGTRSAKPLHVPAWLSRRRSGWVLPIVIGLVCGALLVAQELAQPGPSPQGSRRILVIGVYLFLESAGVLTGYWLLAEPLSLFRRE